MQAAPAKPLVAVFTIEVKRVKLDETVISALSDYLATRLASTGAFDVVPRSQLKSRLVAEKRASFKQCYDQACQCTPRP